MSCLPTYNGKRYDSIELLQEEILSENKLKFSNYLKSLNFTSKQVSELLSDLEDKAISAIINDKIEYQIFNKSTSTNPDIKLTNPDRTMTSGGAKGSDTKWQYHANLNGIGTVTAYRPEHLDKLDKAELNEIENAYTNAANTLKRPVLDSNSEAGRLMRRNYLQVKNADMVVAVGEIVTPNEKDSKGFVNKSGKEIVAGGTGYAVQMAIATNKPVYVFDQFEEKWFKWENTSFVETTVPVLSKRFAGVGTQGLSDAGAKAIEEVFKVNKELDNKAVDNKDNIKNKDIIVSDNNTANKTESNEPKTIKLGTTPSAYPLLNTYLLEGVLRFKTLFKDTFVYTESNKGFSEIIGTINSFYNIPKARHEDVYKATLNGINNFALRYGNSKTLLNMNEHTENRLLGTDSDIKRITKIGFDAYSKLSVANQLLYIKSKYKGLANDSNILYYLRPVTDASRVMNNGFHKIDFKFDSKNPDLKAELNKSFMTLYNSDDVFLKQLAINLVRYNFITSGLSNRVGSFIDIIPYEILTNPVFNIQSGLQLVENEFIKYNVDPIENPTIELIKNYVIDNNLKFANNAGLTIELKDDETLILNSKQLYKLNKLIRNSKVVKAPDLNNVMRFYKVEQVVLLKNDKAMIAKGEDYKDYLVADPTLSDATTTEIGVKLTNLNVSETHKKLAQALFESEDTGDYKASDSKITIEQGKLKFNLALSSNSITNKC
jgi:hypothetical protein